MCGHVLFHACVSLRCGLPAHVLSGVEVQSDTHRHRVWDVCELYFYDAHQDTLDCLARLPRTRQGKLKLGVLHEGGEICVPSAQVSVLCLCTPSHSILQGVCGHAYQHT